MNSRGLMVLITLAAFLAMFIAGCGGAAEPEKKAPDAPEAKTPEPIKTAMGSGPEETVKAFNIALFSGKPEEAVQYLAKDVPEEVKKQMNFAKDVPKEALEKFLSSLKYETTSLEGGKATVQMTMDMKVLMGDAAAAIAAAGGAKAGAMERHVNYLLEKQAGKWVLVNCEEKNK